MMVFKGFGHFVHPKVAETFVATSCTSSTSKFSGLWGPQYVDVYPFEIGDPSTHDAQSHSMQITKIGWPPYFLQVESDFQKPKFNLLLLKFFPFLAWIHWNPMEPHWNPLKISGFLGNFSPLFSMSDPGSRGKYWSCDRSARREGPRTGGAGWGWLMQLEI